MHNLVILVVRIALMLVLIKIWQHQVATIRYHARKGLMSFLCYCYDSIIMFCIVIIVIVWSYIG